MLTTADRKWPNTRLRGWARGDSIVWYSRMAAAPWTMNQHCQKKGLNDLLLRQRILSEGYLTKDPIMTGGPWLWMAALDLKTAAIKATPEKAPTKDQAQLMMFPILGQGSSRWPKKRETGFGSWWTRERGTWGFKCLSMSKLSRLSAGNCISGIKVYDKEDPESKKHGQKRRM